VRQGEPADDLYIVRTGRLAVLNSGSTINTLDDDDWFGEIGLLLRQPRSATVHTLNLRPATQLGSSRFVRLRHLGIVDRGPRAVGIGAGIAEWTRRGSHLFGHLLEISRHAGGSGFLFRVGLVRAGLVGL
jgi:Cyclic nucleotide-binding domain